MNSVKLAFSEKMDRGELASLEEILTLVPEAQGEVPDTSSEKAQEWYEQMTSLSFLKEVILDESVREIIVFGNGLYQLERKGILSPPVPLDVSPADLQLSFEVLALKAQVPWNYSEPFQSFFITLLNQSFRATLLHFSTSPQKSSKLFLRKIASSTHALSDFDLTPDQVELFHNLVLNKSNILISGSTGSGKTSFLRALLNLIPPHEHLVILEDTYEITQDRQSLTQVLADPLLSKKSLQNYCAYALRMRPDRIILGEVRSHEVVPFILSMNTGHEGLMTTVHAKGAKEALSRAALLFSLYAPQKETPLSLALKLICSNIHYVIHLENRRVKEMIQVYGSEQEFPLTEKIF